MATKIQGTRAGPPGGSWRKPNEGLLVEVAGLRSRLNDVRSFIKGAEAAGEGRFGIVARREAPNPHGRHGTTTAIDGWWVSHGFLGGGRRHEVQLGYLPEWAAHEYLRGKSPEPPIFIELDSAYLSDDGFVDVDILIHLPRAADEATEGSAARIAKRARQECMPGLKVLARVAMEKGLDDEIALFAMMADYVATRSSRLGLHVELDVVGQIVEAAVGLAPTDDTVMAATTSLANDDESLDELFRFSLELARAGGEESKAAIALLKRMLATARRCRERGRQ